MSTGVPNLPKAPAGRGPTQARRGEIQRQGIMLLISIVGVMWLIEIINALDNYGLDTDGGIHPRDLGRIWEVFTAPFLHGSWGHLIANTIPFVFMGLIIALHGAKKLALVTAIVIVLGGLGTWLISPAGSVTVGASGVVFGYAGYLLARGLFDRSALEIVTGGLVGAIWGGALLASLVPHTGISWQGHVCGGIAGVIAAWLLADRQGAPKRPSSPSSALDRALSQ
jgi:membrane associated rhomboid family serine protease